MKLVRQLLLGALAIAVAEGLTSAQRGGGGLLGGRGGAGGGRGGGFGGEFQRGNEPMQPLPPDRDGLPTWEVDPHFKNDVFRFVRLRYTTRLAARTLLPGGMNGTSWLNDWPSADMNLSFRLQQLTSLKVDPAPVQMQITDDRLFDSPFAFMLQVGRLEFSDEEVVTLRRYLLNGGFLMVDDHWGPEAHRNWVEQIQRVLPGRNAVELSLEHPIFHAVYDLKSLPQIPAIQLWARNAQAGHPEITARSTIDGGPHYFATYDDKNRMMVLENQNTDTSDGWEREGEDKEFFQRFSEKFAYPLMINIIFYSMTH